MTRRTPTGSSSPIEFVPFEQAYAPGFEDMRRRVPELRRIQEFMSWQPTRSLDQILESVIEHERRAGSGCPTRA